MLEPIDRGFYGATYRCVDEALDEKRVLKVAPVATYAHFGKDFVAECRQHAAVARDSAHVVQILGQFTATIDFGEEQIECHVQVLENLNGIPLAKYFQDAGNLPTLAIAQVAMDLLYIWGEFSVKEEFHNDLHGYNILICESDEAVLQPYNLQPSIRAIAVDLGSVGSETRSDETRLGDQHWVRTHLQTIAQALSRQNPQQDDLRHRLLECILDIIAVLAPNPEHSRTPSHEELIRDLYNSANRRGAPWDSPFQLQSFDDAYNALTLAPWYVPKLLVDPEGTWVRAISSPGPRLVTGMRGCGKTMLLKALQFHARVAQHKGDDDTPEETIRKLADDGYVGLFVSCTRLLEGSGKEPATSPFARLFVAYCRETVRALRHLRELSSGEVPPSYALSIAEAAAACLTTPDGQFSVPMPCTGAMLERKLVSVLLGMQAESSEYSLSTASPKEAFEILAEATQQAARPWGSATVLFLLDDVSTRYMSPERVRDFFSELIFPSETCAFKFTTELQTLEMALNTPGGSAVAREGRDYTLFDLGNEVYRRTRARGNAGKEFLSAILDMRRNYYPRHPQIHPKHVLGDASLNRIAHDIAEHEGAQRQKNAYRGLSALAAVCVGDIGDVIRIYERILRVAGADEKWPVPASLQSECYRFICSRLLFDLNRRGAELRSFAISFAQAAHQLLVESLEEIRKNPDGRGRFRELSSVYVKVSASRQEDQLTMLRQLIDAGVFVLYGSTPRSKDGGDDPFLQFQLTYRKLFGLTSLIGLGSTDRFELDDSGLEEWLSKPDSRRDVLLKSYRAKDPDAPDPEDDGDADVSDDLDDGYRGGGVPLLLFEAAAKESARTRLAKPEATLKIYGPSLVTELGVDDLRDREIDSVVIALGFEDRALDSAKRLFEKVNPRTTTLVRYDESQGAEIEQLAIGSGSEVQYIEYPDLLGHDPEIVGERTLLDVTGMAKPAIFRLVRSVLRRSRALTVLHTHAQDYYPLDEHIREILNAEQTGSYGEALTALGRVLTGEEGGYKVIPLQELATDESLPRVLFTFASAKHEKLFKLLDCREFDSVEIVLPGTDTPRGKVAHMAAEIAALQCSSVVRHERGSFDMLGTLELLEKRVGIWYKDRNYNIEIDASGSKAQAVATAILSLKARLAKVWYVKPVQYDRKKFTRGTGVSRVYHVNLD